MIDRLFVDTGAWFALANRGDPDHRSVRKALEAHSGRLVTTNYVFDETVTLCRFRLGLDAATRIGDRLRSGSVAELARATMEDEARAWELFRRREDKEYSFTDCVSFVMMRRLVIRRAAALDDDFRREGFETVP